MRALAAIAIAIASPALAQCTPALAQAAPPCGPRAVIVARLASAFGETVAYVGLSDDGATVETYANPKTGTWTLLAVDPAGAACVVTYGGGFEAVFKLGEAL